MEGKLVSSLIKKLAEKDNLELSSVEKLQQSTNFLERMFDGLGFCLSEEGDLLSQWRGYAMDGTGISIGFSKSYLASLAKMSGRTVQATGFTLKRVEYERGGQVKLIEPTYQKIKEFIHQGAYKSFAPRTLIDSRTELEINKENEKIRTANKNLLLATLELFPELFLLKNKAFKEEKEWRLLSHLINETEDSCLFRASGDQIIPYREFKLEELDEPSITQVILGPKNRTPHKVIEKFLIGHGFFNVNIVSSDASYQ